MKIKNKAFASDMRPLEEGCTCMTCRRYTRSCLHHAIKAQGLAAPAVAITYHNVAYMQVCGYVWAGLCWLAGWLAGAAAVLSRPAGARPTRAKPPPPTPQGLTRRIRAAIKEQRLPDFVRSFLAGMFPARDVPQWVVDALHFAGISLEGVANLAPAYEHDFYDKVSVARVPLQ
jgi:queuine tRNA-ribosyltransferase